MAQQEKTAAASQDPGTEVVVEVIAGPITAAQLGVPVGTVVSARHVVQNPPPEPWHVRLRRRLGLLPDPTIITPAKAEMLRRRILGQEKEG